MRPSGEPNKYRPRTTPASPALNSRPRPSSWRSTAIRPPPTAALSPKPTPRARFDCPRTCDRSRPTWSGSSPPWRGSPTTPKAKTAVPDNAHFLVKANVRRHVAALAVAHDAIERLGREGRSVNFETVVNAAGVSRAWLYREPEIRELVIRLRALPTRTTARAALWASTDSLRQRLDTARDEISRLRAENSALRDQLARHLGAQRVQPLRHQLGRPR